MAFEAKEWKDGAAGGTPITAAELNRIEQGIADIELTPGPAGPKGDKGDAGTAGAKGAKGDKGDPGFPTETQWNDLVARVTALEAAGS